MAASTDATTDAAPTKDRRAVPAEFIKSFPLSTETGTPDAKASKDGATMGDNNNGEGAEGSTEFGKSKRKFMGYVLVISISYSDLLSFHFCVRGLQLEECNYYGKGFGDLRHE